MIVLLSLPFIYLFTVGAGLAVKSNSKDIQLALWRGVPRNLIIAIYFIIFPLVIWDGFMYHVFFVRKRREERAIKKQMRILGNLLGKIQERHADNQELSDDIEKMKRILK